MSIVKSSVSISVDCFMAGPNQSLEKPFGDIEENLLHHWMFDEPEKHKAELDDLTDAGAFIMGANMFGPKEQREHEDWKGWWGDNPPYHGPVFVLTHHKRDDIKMEGGTTFIFVTDGIESALKQAKKAAGDKDISIAGGANTINQFLKAGLLDQLWLHIVPVTIGSGAQLFVDTPNLRMKPVEARATTLVTHLKYKVLN